MSNQLMGTTCSDADFPWQVFIGALSRPAKETPPLSISIFRIKQRLFTWKLFPSAKSSMQATIAACRQKNKWQKYIVEQTVGYSILRLFSADKNSYLFSLSGCSKPMRFRPALKLMQNSCRVFILNERSTANISASRGVIDYAIDHSAIEAIITVRVQLVESWKNQDQTEEEDKNPHKNCTGDC